MSKTLTSLLVIPITLISIASLASLVYLWIILGERGLEADANGTAGYTTTSEVLLGGLAILGLGCSVVMYVIIFNARIADRRRGE